MHVEYGYGRFTVNGATSLDVEFVASVDGAVRDRATLTKPRNFCRAWRRRRLDAKLPLPASTASNASALEVAAAHWSTAAAAAVVGLRPVA